MADGKVRIRVEDNAQQSARNFDKLDRELKDVSSSASKTDKSMVSLKNALVGVGSFLAVREVSRFAGALINAASDAEETANKFNVVFQDVRDEATQTADEIAESFGLSSKASQQFLSDTGDLLTGLGFTGEKALEVSDAVTRLAVDLASFTNVEGGATRASQALTSALLGEREAVKSLGIAIGEADIKRLAEEKGIVGELDRQQKALLTLELALGQSKNAIGDFARSQDSFANSSRVLDGAIEDLSATLGEVLLPTATDTVSVLSDLVRGIDDFVSGTFTLDGKIRETEEVIASLKEEISQGVGFFDGIFGLSAEKRLEFFNKQLADLKAERDALAKTEPIQQAIVPTESVSAPVEKLQKVIQDVETKTSKVAEESAEKTSKIIDLAKDGVDDLGDGFADVLTGGFKSGEDAARQFGGVVLDILGGIAKKIAQEKLAGLFTSVISSFTGGEGGDVTANAKGNAFENGSVKAFAKGGVVNAPTFFPMANGGTGLMGEAGAEAIMPLRRTSDGRLGVEAQGASPTINVINNSQAQIETVQRPNNEFDIIVREVSAVLSSQRSDGAVSSALARQRSSGVQGA